MDEALLQQRAQRVAALSAQGKAPAAIQAALSEMGVTNPATGLPYSLSTVRNDLRRTPGRAPVREMIGRTAPLAAYGYGSSTRHASRLTTLSVDRTQPDYANWDKLRRGVLRGFELGGLFCQPITDTLTAFVLGKALTATLAESGDASDPSDPRTRTDQALEAFTSQWHPLIQQVYGDMLALGDQYVIVNPDGTLSTPSPETVDLETDPLDYRRLVKVTVTTALEKATVTDVYTAEQRAVTVTWKVTDADGHVAGKQDRTTYSNLLGEIPLVHFACARSANEVYGHPVYLALFRLFSRYDDLLEKALDGVELMGNPVPTFTGIADVRKTLADLAAATGEDYSDVDGEAETRSVVRMDRLPFWILGAGADAKFVSPEPGFTTDIVNMLKTLFVLICYYAQIPEFAFGAGMDATRASTETQMPILVQHIDLLRSKAQPPIQDLVRLWLKTRKLTQPTLVVDRIRITYPEISLDSATVTLQKTIYAKGIGAIRRAKASEILRLVPDPYKEDQLAQEEAAKEAQSAADEYMTQVNAAAHAQQNPVANSPAEKTPTLTTLKPPLPAGGRRARMENGQRVGEPAASNGNGNGSGRRRRRRRQTESAQ